MIDTFAKNYVHSSKDELIRIYQILVTTQCNLRCKYCYQDFERKPMDNTISDDIVDKIVELESTINTGEIVHLQFFGGEPLLNVDLIERMTDRFAEKAEKVGLHYGFHVATNGTIFNSHFASIVKKHNGKFKLTISLDGRKDIHNSRRGGYDKIMENLPKFKELFGVEKIKLSTTFGPDTIHTLYDCFYHSTVELGIPNYKYNIEINNPDMFKDNVANVFKSELMKCAEYILQPENINVIRFWNIHYNCFKHIDNDPVCKFCKSNITVDVDGTFVNCAMFKNNPENSFWNDFYLGKYLDPAENLLDNKHKAFTSTANRSELIETFKNCVSCEINSGCKKCPASVRELDGKLYGTPFHCKIHKAEFEVFKYMLNYSSQKYI